MDGNKLANVAETCKTREDFLQFLHYLSQNIISNPSEWENDKLAVFLSALSRWAMDSDGYYENIHDGKVDIEKPSWRLFADMLLAAKTYE